MTFDTLPFDEAGLSNALSNDFVSADEVKARASTKYLLDYLKAIQAQTIVVERDYTDGDYLDDWASYYYSCFETYPRLCKRLHFFSEHIEPPAAEDMIAGAIAPTVLQSSYLGFVVARPLPDTIIGRTVLATYPPDRGRRHYPATHDYRPHLAGIPLSIRSLAFQEQDTVTAACATVALWSAFHQTSRLFDGTNRPRPARITEAASVVRTDARTLPSHGLNIEQMCEAIRSAGLEPEVLPVSSQTPVASIAYAYLSMGLPVVLVAYIEDLGLHAITLTGYSMLAVAAPVPEPVMGNVHSVARAIDEFYGHDDQMGPFARMQLIAAAPADSAPFAFYGSWLKADGTKRRIVPRTLLVPVYEKIRLSFPEMLAWVKRATAFFMFGGVAAQDLEWDITLTTTNDYKERLIDPSEPRAVEQRALLGEQQPRFIWRARLRFQANPFFDLLGDATDFGSEHSITHSFPLFRVAWFSATHKKVIEEFVKSIRPDAEQILGRKLAALLAGDPNPRLRH